VLYGLNHEPHLISLIQLNNFLKSLVKSSGIWGRITNFQYIVWIKQQGIPNMKRFSTLALW